MKAGRTPIVIGGDHSVSMGSIAGVARHAAETERELFVLWLDAHTDFNTPATSPSGNMHGMPAAMLCREPGFEGLLGEEPHDFVDPRNLLLFGVRSIDDGERRLLRARGVDVVDMRVLDEYGAAATIRRIIERVRSRGGILHVSLDLDFLDPSLAPGVGTPVPGGATFREAHLTMELLYDSGLVGSVDLVELNPFLDERGKSATLHGRSRRQPVRPQGFLTRRRRRRHQGIARRQIRRQGGRRGGKESASAGLARGHYKLQ